MLCEDRTFPVPAAHTSFAGFSYLEALISRVEVTYLDQKIPESIDDLYFSPGSGVLPTRIPAPTWTPIPSAVPTQGPAPTATPVVPMISYYPVLQLIPGPLFFTPDFAIHGIEITQGIQCFNTAAGLSGCPDNSLPVVNKKDSTARIYLKANNASSTFNNIPVRLYIIANGVDLHRQFLRQNHHHDQPGAERQRQHLVQCQLQFQRRRGFLRRGRPGQPVC